MVNGPEQIFIEKSRVPPSGSGVKLTPESLIVAVKTLPDDWVTTFQKRSHP